MDTTTGTNPQPLSADKHRRPIFTGRLIVGLSIIFVGVLFLLDAFNIPGIGDVWHYVHRLWPLVFIFIGLSKLSNSRTPGEWLACSIWFLLGVVFLADNFNLINFNIWRAFWPVVIILFGVSMLNRATSGRFLHPGGGRSSGLGGPVDSTARTSAVAVMSSSTRRVSSPDFQGGDATALMGGCQIDLRQCNIVTGPAVFDVYALMGGIDIFVPGDWTVRNEGMAILGAIEDSRKETAGNPAKVLIIRGAALMGGVEIKN